MSEGDGVLELGKGSFRITRPLILDTTTRGYVGVRGEQGTARLLMDGAGPALQIIGDHHGTATPKTVQPHTWGKERFPVISGLEILGRHPEADGIQLLHTMQTTVQNVLIRNCRHGIHLAKRNRNFLLNASHIYDCSDTGVFFDHCNLHQVIISANHISYCKRAGIRQLDGDVHNIQITGNDIEYNSGAEGTTGEIVLEAPNETISEYTIASNTLQATRPARDANVLILGRKGVNATAARLIAITGNVIGSRDKSILINDASKVNISGNTIYDGIALNVEMNDCQNVVIGANTIGTRPINWNSTSNDGVLLRRCIGAVVANNMLNDIRAGDEKQGGAITLQACRDSSVSGCQILNPHIRGIDVQGSQRCKISDNSVTEQRDESQMLNAIRVAEDSRQCLVQNNAVTGGTNAPIDCPGEKGKESGNTIWE